MPPSSSSMAGPSGLSCTSMPCVSSMCFCVDTINALCGETMYIMNVAIVLVLVCM